RCRESIWMSPRISEGLMKDWGKSPVILPGKCLSDSSVYRDHGPRGFGRSIRGQKQDGLRHILRCDLYFEKGSRYTVLLKFLRGNSVSFRAGGPNFFRPDSGPLEYGIGIDQVDTDAEFRSLDR